MSVTLFRYIQLKRPAILSKLHTLTTSGATQYIKNQAKVAIKFIDDPLNQVGRKAMELSLRQP